ncbi:hypothetical protein EA473_13660 [Natrarchaeobius chitinivorans]|uniref:Uncharacterized protein n=1 Tax=Natrarchaeobius chitinivorans TaxID=1679083 RepID=A0A3N6PBU1_NATCH|nr:hypothetical protein EA473_13660 [Natrarchaeobius chitinivorans]
MDPVLELNATDAAYFAAPPAELRHGGQYIHVTRDWEQRPTLTPSTADDFGALGTMPLYRQGASSTLRTIPRRMRFSARDRSDALKYSRRFGCECNRRLAGIAGEPDWTVGVRRGFIPRMAYDLVRRK